MTARRTWEQGGGEGKSRGGDEMNSKRVWTEETKKVQCNSIVT